MKKSPRRVKVQKLSTYCNDTEHSFVAITMKTLHRMIKQPDTLTSHTYVLYCQKCGKPRTL